MNWQIKQRVISRSEPELGLGIVTGLDEQSDQLEVFFPAVEESRLYSLLTAPVKRFLLESGQKLWDRNGNEHLIEKVHMDTDDRAQYFCQNNLTFWEWELSDSPSMQQGNVIESLIYRQWTHHRTYDLRKEAWHIRSLSQAQKVRGMVGPRVTPLSHQLYIASEVSRRRKPRVVLADEVGLGKTIEAGLIFSSLKSLGRAEKVMILAPNALVNQWVAELYRRFGEMFSIIDSERCQEEEDSLKMSAFEANQRVIASMDFFLEEPGRLQEACEVNWDLIIVDEAHHLDWDEEQPDPKWAVAKKLSRKTEGLLLLTATPRQHGLCTQFGLLNLVDPERFSDYESFLEESEHLQTIAAVARQIQFGEPSPHLKERLASLFLGDKQAENLLAKGVDKNRLELLNMLVDRHGTGRVLFRNRRERLQGFPQRSLNAVALNPSDGMSHNLSSQIWTDLEMLHVMDYMTARGAERSYKDQPEQDPRFQWLADFLDERSEEKVFIICSTRRKVMEVSAYLGEKNIEVGVFHDGLKVVDRDRQAAIFADPKGVSALISSEIGGEGRNFQFAKTLVLLDLPHHPDLLEQRIGRLDRIGQGKKIEIVVPYLKDTPEEALFKWLHHGINGFENSWNGADPFIDEFGEQLIETACSFFKTHPEHEKRQEKLNSLLDCTRVFAEQLLDEREKSVDILIDLNSYDEQKGLGLLEAVEDLDDDPSLEFFMRSMFDQYGVDYEELDDRGSLIVKAEELMFIDQFPGLPANEDTSIAFDRSVALAREDVQFVTCDHAITHGALALLLDRNEGVASVCKWPHAPNGDGVLIEFSILLAAEGRSDLELAHYLPIDCLELQLNHLGEFIKQEQHQKNPEILQEINENDIPGDLERLRSSIESMLEQAMKKAYKWSEERIGTALRAAISDLDAEIGRLEYLSLVNSSVRESDIEYAKVKKAEVIDSLKKTKPRLDGIRLIFTER